MCCKYIPTTGVGDAIRYWPNDGVCSWFIGILRTLIGVRAVGTGIIGCLGCVCGVTPILIGCFCGVDKLDDAIILWLGDAIAIRPEQNPIEFRKFVYNKKKKKKSM